jgi:hypothetical protein
MKCVGAGRHDAWLLRPDPELLDSLDDRLAEEFAAVSVVQTPETLHRSATRS